MSHDSWAALPRGIVIFPDHTHLLFLILIDSKSGEILMPNDLIALGLC